MKRAFSLVTILSLFVALAFGFTAPAYAVFVNDGCTDVVGSNTHLLNGDNADADIDTVDVTSNGTEITVVVTLCGEVNDKVKYRVHFDYTDQDGAFGNEAADSLEDNPDCETRSDDTVKFLRRRPEGKKVTGPGDVEQTDANELTFTVDYGDLEKNGTVLETDDVVLIWVETQWKTVNDRAPDTDGTDDCEEPEEADEVITLILS